MIIKDVISSVEKLRPGSMMSEEEYFSCINRLEELIYGNIISRYENTAKFDRHTDDSDTLLVPDMYGALYRHFLLAEIDLRNGDITRYTNNMILYNGMLSDFFDYCIRTRTPKQYGKVRWR